MPYKDPDQQRTFQREWVARRRADWLAANGPCANCGSPFRLEIDHINADEKVSHRVWTWSDERREAELLKCQVLCHVCHQVKTKVTIDNRHFGTVNGQSKLTIDDVRAIRASSDGQRALGRRHGVSHTTIARILRRELWSQVN